MGFGDIANLFKPTAEPQFTSTISKQKITPRNPKDEDRGITDEYKMNISQLKGAMKLRERAWRMSQKNNASPELQAYYKNQYDYYKMVFDLRNRGEIDVNKLHSYKFLDDRKEVINSDRQRLQAQLDKLGRDADKAQADNLRNLLRKLDEEQKNIEEAQRINREKNEAEKEKRKKQMEADEEKKFEEKDKKEKDPELKEMDDESLQRYKENLQEQLRDAKDPMVQAGMKDSIADIEREEKRRQSQSQAESEANARKQANEDARQKDIEQQKAKNKAEEEDKERRDVNQRAREQDIEDEKQRKARRHGDRDRARGRGDFDPNDDIDRQHPDGTSPDEVTEGISTLQSDPFIETGKENIPDATIFRQMIHVGTELAFEFVKYQTGYKPAIDLTQTAVKRIFNTELNDLVDVALNAVSNNKKSDIGTLRGSAPNRIKLQVKDVEMEQHSVINNPVLYPLMVIAFKFYLAEKQIEMGYMANNVFQYGLEYLMKNFVKSPESNVRYMMYLWSNFPQSLIEAYLRNRPAINSVTQSEKDAVNNYHSLAIKEYDRLFSPNTFLKDVKRYEHGGTELNQMIINLSNPVFLYEIGQVFTAVDNFILNVKDNQGLLLGLMGVLYSRAVGEGTNMGDALLANARVDGIVYYNRQTDAPKFKSLEIDLLNNAKDDVEEKIIDGVSYIIFRGTNFRQEKFLERDFMLNILNLAGSNELFSNEAFDGRIVKATNLIYQREREGIPIKIIGYSLGGIYALYMSSIFPNIATTLYSPVLANNKATQEFMDSLEKQQPNLNINYIEGDPFSNNVPKYEGRFNIKKQKKSRFFDSHQLENYLFKN